MKLTKIAKLNVICFVLLFSELTVAREIIDRESCAKFGKSYVADQIQSDLNWLRTLRGNGGATPYHKRLFGGPVDGNLYTKYIYKKINKIHCVDDLSTRDQKTNNSHPAFYSGGDVYINESDFKAPRPAGPASGLEFERLDMLALLTHEATHRDVGHIYCPTGQAAGEDECDSSYHGANAAESIFIYNLAKYCENCLSDPGKYNMLFGFGIGQLVFVLGADHTNLVNDAGELDQDRLNPPGKRWGW